jgi:hypothetical protein
MGRKGACLILHHEMLIRCLYVVCLLHCKAIDKTKQKLEYLQNPATFSGATDAMNNSNKRGLLRRERIPFWH